MPTFYADDIDVSPGEFLDSCDSSDIRELIDALIEDGHIKKTSVEANSPGSRLSVDETIFEEHLSSLQGRRHMLTTEEEQTIIKIASKFRYL